MLQTAYVTREYSKDEKIELEGITSLAVFNDSDGDVIVNGKPIRKGNKETIITGDNTYSNLIIDLVFSDVIETELNGGVRGLDKDGKPQPVKKSVLFMYKKLV